MLAAVAKCSRCAAVVNTQWKVCLVCQAILPPVSGTLSPSETTSDNSKRTRALHPEPSLSVDHAVQLQEKNLDPVRPVLQAGDLVEWLSPALPKQREEVLAVYDNGTFEVWHPLTEAICRLPVAWVMRILNGPTSTIPEKPIW